MSGTSYSSVFGSYGFFDGAGNTSGCHATSGGTGAFSSGHYAN
jgi:hypothetical protein